MVKLSENQKEVIKKMKEGWNLGTTRAGGIRPILQQGELGYGGNTFGITYTTFNSLRKEGIIKFKKRGQVMNIYLLTDIGKTIDIS